MKKRSIFLLLLFCFFSCQKADHMEPEYFDFGINHNNNTYQTARSIAITSDNGFVTSGFTFGTDEIPEGLYLLKTDSEGKKLWIKTYGGGNNNFSSTVHLTPDNGFILGGTLDDEMYLVKTNGSGEMLWSKTYEKWNIQSIVLTDDGGYIISGSDDQGHIIKTDSEGEVMWSRLHETSEWGQSKVIDSEDGEYLIFGINYDGSDGNINLLKIDAQGETVWSTVMDREGDNRIHSAVPDPHGKGFYLCGRSDRRGKRTWDILLMKVDEEGNEIWSRTYDGYGSDIGYSIIASQDGNYIICGSEGYTDSGDAAIVLMKVDEYGSQIWKHEYGGKEADIGYQVVETSSNELLIVATSQTEEDYSLNEPCYSQMVLLKTDSEGELLWP